MNLFTLDKFLNLKKGVDIKMDSSTLLKKIQLIIDCLVVIINISP